MPQVLVNGIRAAYEVAGEGPDVVFIHGWMASKRYWHEASKRIPGFRVWALDLYGFGDSEKPMKGYTLDNYATFVRGFLDAVRIRRVAVVGHSMGGAVSAWTVMSSPERYWALGLVDAALSGLASPPPAWSAEPLMRMFMRLADTSKSLGKLAIMNMFGVRESESRIMLDEARKADVRSAAACGEMMSRVSDWRGLSRLKSPALIVYGQGDFLLNRGMDREVQSLLPHAELHYISNCGHIPMLEASDKFYGILRAFLEKSRGAF